jgi:protein-S-isoprenylcysteine O-methyltransferase Ste14
LLKDGSALFCFTGLLINLSKEERFMQEAFGEKWKVYRSKVKRLIPWLMLLEIFPLFQ